METDTQRDLSVMWETAVPNYAPSTSSSGLGPALGTPVPWRTSLTLPSLPFCGRGQGASLHLSHREGPRLQTQLKEAGSGGQDLMS